MIESFWEKCLEEKKEISDNERLRRLVIENIFEVIHIYISVHKIHLASSKYFTTNGSVSTPIAFPMDKSLDISVFSFRLFSAVQFYILLKRAILHKININQILPILPNFTQFFDFEIFKQDQIFQNYRPVSLTRIGRFLED